MKINVTIQQQLKWIERNFALGSLIKNGVTCFLTKDITCVLMFHYYQWMHQIIFSQ